VVVRLFSVRRTPVLGRRGIAGLIDVPIRKLAAEVGTNEFQSAQLELSVDSD